MIRVILFLITVSLIALGVTWLADRPGDIAITWQGWRIETSMMIGTLGVILIVIAAMLAWSLARLVLRSPALVSRALHRRRRRRFHAAISRGLIAIGAGDAMAAHKFAKETARLLPSEPLTLLLGSQAAQLNNDRAGADAAFRAMASRSDTKLFGLRGLYVEAQRRRDNQAAREFAEAAAQLAPTLPWAGQAVLNFRCADRDWAGALDILSNQLQGHGLDVPTYRRWRAVLLTARAIDADETHRDAVRLWVLEAVKLAPDLVPTAVLAGRLLANAGEIRKASKILEAAWRRHPHPDLAESYAHVRLADSARDRLARIRALTRLSEGHIEGALALARAALDAREFDLARQALEPFHAHPTQRVAMLFAEIEQIEHGDEGRAREWMARAVRAERDPQWTADGFVSETWMPVSPVTGRIDAFEWKVPVAMLSEAGPVIEDRAEVPAEPTELASVSAISVADRGPAEASAPVAETIIPLIHAPDDPGPEPDPEIEGRVPLVTHGFAAP